MQVQFHSLGLLSRDITADVKVWRGGGKGARAAQGFALMDVQLLATSEEPGGEQTATAAPPPL